MNTRIYVDGFNFYYGCLKGSPYKWLDLHKLLYEIILPTSIDYPCAPIEHGIYFYTAKITEKAAKSRDSIDDQNAYLRAISAISSQVKLIEGAYAISETIAYRVEKDKNGKQRKPAQSERIAVWKIEEKQSDVNLAIDIVTDALTLSELEHIVVVTNDTDILPAIARIKELTNIKVGIVSPIINSFNNRRPNKNLVEIADWIRTSIKSDELARSQLPRVIKTGGRKDALKPISWYGQPKILNKIIETLLPALKSKRNQCWRWLEQNHDKTTNKPFIELLDDQQTALMVLEKAQRFVATQTE